MENIKQKGNTKNENRNSSGPKKSNTIDNEKNKLIVVIRISGMVKVRREITETLYRLKLRRKYSCVIVRPTKSILGMLDKAKHYVSYGEIDKETYDKLVKTRGKKVNNKLKPFFRLHPPRGGINSKKQYPKGVLGKNKDINKLIQRML